jgi:lysophospholipid acyltransferase (LPLAT)-like uncharacterized protein
VWKYKICFVYLCWAFSDITGFFHSYKPNLLMFWHPSFLVGEIAYINLGKYSQTILSNSIR